MGSLITVNKKPFETKFLAKKTKKILMERKIWLFLGVVYKGKSIRVISKTFYDKMVCVPVKTNTNPKYVVALV